MRNPILQFFKYDHLPMFMKAASKPFCELAELVDSTAPDNPEKDECLRKLLEAKDCAVRARLYSIMGPKEETKNEPE